MKTVDFPLSGKCILVLQDGDKLKIKEVCEKTGLSDKTIRYYIRSGLIFPKYNENYTGRKNFDFSEKDIERLNQVVILRKYNFSINSIKAILDNNENIYSIVKTHIEAMREENNNSAQLLSKLDDVINSEFSNAADLCKMLCETESLPQSVPNSDNRKPYKLLYSKNKKANRVLIALISILVLISAVLFSEIYSNIRCITDSSIININNGFVGIRIIEADDKHDGIQYVNDLFIEDDCLITESDKFDEYSTSVEKSFISRDTITIHAVLNSDKAMIKIVPIYENRYAGEMIYCNSSCWLGLEGADSVTAKSQFSMKSKKYNYQYDIKINNDDIIEKAEQF